MEIQVCTNHDPRGMVGATIGDQSFTFEYILKIFSRPKDNIYLKASWYRVRGPRSLRWAMWPMGLLFFCLSHNFEVCSPTFCDFFKFALPPPFQNQSYASGCVQTGVYLSIGSSYTLVTVNKMHSFLTSGPRCHVQISNTTDFTDLGQLQWYYLWYYMYIVIC